MTQINIADRRDLARALRAAADVLDPEPAAAGPRYVPCGAPTPGGFTCVLPAGHNLGRADVPENHRAAPRATLGHDVLTAELHRTSALVSDMANQLTAAGYVVGADADAPKRLQEVLGVLAAYAAAPAVVAAEPRTGPPEGDGNPPGGSGGSETVLAVVEAARAWRAGIRLTADEAGPNSAALMRAVDVLNAPLDNGQEPVTLGGLLDAEGRAAMAKGWAAGVRWAAAEADAQSAWRDPVYILDVTDHLRLCVDNPGRGTAVSRDHAPVGAEVDDKRPADRRGAGYDCTRQPTEPGGVWSSYVEYLNHLEHVVMAAREWRSFRGQVWEHDKLETCDLIRAVDSLDHPEGT